MIKNEGNSGYAVAEATLLLQFSQQEATKTPSIEYFVFGHRHIPTIVEIPPKAKCVILGDWVKHFSYGQFDGETFEIKYFEKD